VKRKLLLALSIALIAVMTFSTATFAWGWEDVDVELSEITVDGGHNVGTVVTASGTVTITAEGVAIGFPSYAYAESKGIYRIKDPEGALVERSVNTVGDDDSGLLWATADASQVFNWSSTFTLEQGGYYSIKHRGIAMAGYETGFWFWEDSGEATDSTASSILWRAKYPMFSPLENWGCPAQFYLRVGQASYSQNYHWADGSTGGTTIRDDISQVGAINGGQYRIDISAGTVITNYGNRSAGYLLFSMNGGGPYFEQKNLDFSKPVVLYELENGTWVELLTFTAIVGGRAQ